MKLHCPCWLLVGMIVVAGVLAYLYGKQAGQVEECQAVDLHGVVVWTGDCSDVEDHLI